MPVSIPKPEFAKVRAIGTDLLDSQRIAQSLNRHGLRLARRILTATELELWHSRNDSANFLAKQFAAKEALAKALGTGIAQGVGFQQMEVLRDELGAPVVQLYGQAAARLTELGAQKALLSLSDEGDWVLAFAVLS